MSLKMGPLMAPRYKQEWETAMAKRYGEGNYPLTGPDCYEAWMSEYVYSLSQRLDFATIEKEELKCAVRDHKKQRNIAFILCAVFFVLTLFFAFRTMPAASTQRTYPASAAHTQTQRAEPEEKYVASVNSSKYHRLTCDYADNILEENRVYYAMEHEAEVAGKSPCSVCRP